ncbi:MAG: hypothetical protein HY875_12700 [Chloroflexi bacterium]|nr:hypothetical protein [Chloroflexota bacterium]
MSGNGERRAFTIARICAGPLALAGFFLPWAQGPGPLAATSFSGFGLVGFAGRLQALDLAPAQSGALLAARLLVLGVAVAAAWQCALAPAHRWHPVYAISGWYVAGFAALAIALGASRSGLTVPPVGLALLVAGGALFAAAELGRWVSGLREARLEVVQPLRREAK